MRILTVHNYYQQPGGEDDVFATERDLLTAHGHEVTAYVRRNDEIRDYTPLQHASLALRTTWAWDSHAAVRDLLRRDPPDLVHFQNTFPLVSPAAYYACREAGVPVVQGLHNARLLCPGGNYYRNGAICQDCLGKSIPWPGVLHGCYRGSRAQTAVVAAMLSVHNLAHTFRDKVDSYITFSALYRRLFLEAGFAEDRVFLKPHFVAYDPGAATEPGSYALFIGRLSPEKGARVLLKAWEGLPDIPLKVRGEGDLLADVQRLAARHPAVKLVPRLDRAAYFSLLRGARFLLWPSPGYYETFGRVAIEAFAAGVPVLGSNVGTAAELVADRQTGLHFNPEDADDVAAQVRWAWQHPAEMRQMGVRARAAYEAKYTAERNYGMLLHIYEATLERRSAQGMMR